jgi:hypothetical protein
MSLVDRIGWFLLVCVVVGASGWSLMSKLKEGTYKEGDCIKMNFDGVESWHYGMTSRIESIGKDNYGVKYWLEYGWSTGVGTIPFTVNVTKVSCPQITESQDESH